jgi:nucleotide-binding universal stress UspA family protein
MTTIVVGMDGSVGAKAALAWACAEARREPGTKIVALSAWLSPIPATSPWVVGYDLPIDLSEATTAELADSVAAVAATGFADVAIQQRVVCGSAAAVLIAQAATADMLVVGSRGLGGFKELVLGSVSHQVVTHAPCPIVIVPHTDAKREGETARDNAIVVGVDGSPNSIAALQWAARRAQLSGAVVHAVYAWQLPATATALIGDGAASPEPMIHAASEALTDYITTAQLPSDVQVVPAVREGSPAKVLLNKAKQAALIVVGARGHGGFVGLLLGSVATAVTHHAPCPVAVIPDR